MSPITLKKSLSIKHFVAALLLCLLAIGYVTHAKVLEFNPSNAQFRISNQVFGIRIQSSYRDSWLTPHSNSDLYDWQVVRKVTNGSRSLWHCAAAEFSVDLRGIGYYENLEYLSPTASRTIATAVLDQLNSQPNLEHGISNAHDFVLCMLQNLPDFSTQEVEIPDDVALSILDACRDNLDN